jgi:Tfp pilus assembly PilM family ATPase
VLFGGQTIIDALAEQRDIDDQGAQRSATPPGADEAHASDEMVARDIVRAQSRRLIDEIKSSIDYCTAQRDIPPIDRIVLTGGASQLPELPEQMADDLRLDITTGSPLGALDKSKSSIRDETLAEAEPFLAVAVGLALGVPS